MKLPAILSSVDAVTDLLAKLPMKLSARTSPFTSSLYAGEVVPMPTLPEEFIVVREGITGEDIKQAVIAGKIGDIIIKDQSLYIAAEFVRMKDSKAYISYINESNAKKGYCNSIVSGSNQHLRLN